MSLFDTTQVALERAISGATLRHSVLARNLSNANTPGYVPSDVDFHSALRDALSERPGATDSGTRSSVEAADIAAVRSGEVLRADGNGVDVDVEAARLAENGLELNALVQVAGARIDILRTAMGAR